MHQHCARWNSAVTTALLLAVLPLLIRTPVLAFGTPSWSIVPSNLSFGSVTVEASSSAQLVNLANLSQAQINIESIVVNGPFSETNNCRGVVKPKSSCSISVTFRPTTAGLVSGNIIVSVVEGTGVSPYAIALSGTGIGVPIPVFSLSTLTFPNLSIGSSSAPQIVTLSNLGQASLTVTAVSISNDFSETNTCARTLRPQDSCSFSIAFQPSSIGLRIGYLSITDTAAGSPHNVSLSGSGIGVPSALMQPSSLSFAPLTLGSTSSAQTILLTNPGNASLPLNTISTAGSFAQRNACPAILLPQTSCSIYVTFSPQVLGAIVGSLVVNAGTGQGSSTALPLTGLGLGVAQVQFSTPAISFPNATVGTASPALQTTLSNSGNADLVIDSMAIAGEFGQTNTCSTTIHPGGSCVVSLIFQPSNAGVASGVLTINDNAPGSPHTVALNGTGSNITAVWANEGGDKVSQDETRASTQTENLTGHVHNRAWNGTTILLSGAHNEVISFNLILEAAKTDASKITVRFDTLSGPGGVQIHSSPATSNGVFQWVNRPIELFYARYVQIKGLSYFGYGKWDERQIPVRFQRPYLGAGQGYGQWSDRPDHDKFYPDALVPLELINSFSISHGQNQSIWSDIYIPKTAPSGIYRGTVYIQENGTDTVAVPVQLTVNNFALPDEPTAKTMVNLDINDIQDRFVAGWGGYANWQTPAGLRVQAITDRYFELFHRHKLDVIGQNECPVFDHPCDSSLPRLTGTLYSASNGYDGPGVKTPTGIFSIGTYDTWGDPQYGVPGWKYDENLFWQHTNNYVSWFEANLPSTEFHLYLKDEPQPQDFAQVETWAKWIKANPGPGGRMHSFVTRQMALAVDDMPDVDIPASPAGLGVCPGNAANCDSPAVEQSIADFYRTQSPHQLWIYNDGRPGVGTAMTEDDGVAMRTIPWAQYKKQVHRWFYWEANVDSPIDWYAQANTWGTITYVDSSLGQTGNDGTSNGNGVLVYPGSTVYNNQTNYGVDGPIASLRLKEWRRGIQDTDYLSLAARIDPTAAQSIVNHVMPYSLWEYPTTSPSFYTGGGPSWSSDPDTWELARTQLALIISNYCQANPTETPCQ